LKLFRRNKELLTPEEKKERNKNRMLLISAGILMGISFPPFPLSFSTADVLRAGSAFHGN
jgi:hypothetical protein